MRSRAPFAVGLLWAVEEGYFAVGYGEECEFRVYDGEGASVGEVVGNGVGRAVNGRDRSRYERWYLEEGPFGDGWREVRERLLREAEWRTHVPLCDKLVIDKLGNLWIGEFTIEGEQRWWQVHRRDGRYLARVQLPRKARILEIGADYVVGVVKGGYDEEMVIVFGLQKR